MRTCSNCGQPLADGAAFCGACGAPAPSGPSTVNELLFCPNCGEKLRPDAGFCPNCGSALPKTASPAKKAPLSEHQRHRIIGIAAAAIAVLLVVVVFAKAVPALMGRTGPFASPAARFVAYQEEIFISRLLTAAEDALDTYGTGSLSTDITVTGSVNNAMINRYLTGSSVLLKVDLKPDRLLANGELSLMGSPVLTGDLSYDKGILEFYLPELSDSRYVMNLSTLASNLGDQDLDLSGLKLPQISGKEWRSLAETYLDLVYTAVTKESVKVERDTRFKLEELGGSFTGTVYTFTPQAEDVKAMILKLADHLEKDKTLRKLVLELVNPDMLTRAFGANVFGSSDPEEDLEDTLNELAEELRANAGEIGDRAERCITWSVYLEGDEVRMVRVIDQFSKVAVVYECKGKASEERSEMLYGVSEYYGAKEFCIANRYTKKGGTYTGEATLTTGYNGQAFLSYDMDPGKKSVLGIPYGTYEMTAPYGDVSIKLEVSKGAKGGTDHLATLRSEYSFDEFTRMEVNFHTTDKSSAKKPGGKAMDISDFSARDLQELYQELSGVLYMDLFRNLGPLLDI